MKKYLLLIIIIISIWLFPMNVGASSAFCTYEYESTIVKVKYEYGKEPIAYDSYKNNNKNNEFKEIKMVNKDFVDSKGNIVCPNVKVTRTAASGRNHYKITLVAEPNGALKGILSDLKDDGKEKESPSANNYTCKYYTGTDKEFHLTWSSGSLQANLVGDEYEDYCGTLFKGSFSDTDFENGKCPEVYTLRNLRETGTGCRGKLTISKEKILTENDKETESDGKEDTYTGEEIPTLPQTKPNEYEQELDYSSICSNTTEGNRGIRQTFKIVGYLIQIIKWIVPLIIIILGMIDFGKAAISNDEKAINKAMMALIRRLIAGIVIFFIPTIVMAILNIIEVSKGIEKKDNSQFGACTKCLFDPYNSCEINKTGSSNNSAGGGSNSSGGGLHIPGNKVEQITK